MKLQLWSLNEHRRNILWTQCSFWNHFTPMWDGWTFFPQFSRSFDDVKQLLDAPLEPSNTKSFHSGQVKHIVNLAWKMSNIWKRLHKYAPSFWMQTTLIEKSWHNSQQPHTQKLKMLSRLTLSSPKVRSPTLIRPILSSPMPSSTMFNANSRKIFSKV